MNKNRKYWGFLFVAPQLIGLIIFSLVPLIQTVGMSFMHWDITKPEENHFVGIQNYLNQFANEEFWDSFANTIEYMLYYVPANIILAMLIAIALKNVAGKTMYRLFYFMPVISGSVSVGVIWTWMLNADTGLINGVLAQMGIEGVKWLTDPDLVLASIAMVTVWWQVGYNMVIFLAGLQNIPQTYYEAASIDGAGRFSQFWHITLPMVSSTTFFTLITTIIGSFQIFDQAHVMTQGGPARASYTVVYNIYDHAFQKFIMGEASAIAMCLFVVILGITALQMALQKRWVNYDV